MEITQKRLKELLHYNKNTGIFTNRTTRSSVAKANEIAGGKNKYGYIVITLDYKEYYAHRLAILYMFGYPPKFHIDHKNHNKSDNKINNLRDVTILDNQRNRSLSVNNSTGFNGVHFDKVNRKYVASIKIKGKKIHLGRYKDKQDAINARKKANIKYNFHTNHGK